MLLSSIPLTFFRRTAGKITDTYRIIAEHVSIKFSQIIPVVVRDELKQQHIENY